MRRASIPCLCLLLLLLSPAARGDEGDLDPIEQALANPVATGLLVTNVQPETQAESLGVHLGDTLVSYGGKALATIDDLRDAIGAQGAAATVELKVVRLDGTEKSFTLAPGRIGVELMPVKKGEKAVLPPATDVAFDFAALKAAPRDEWYAFGMPGLGQRGFEHARVALEDGNLVMRREVAFDGAQQWGLNHFDVTVVVTATPVPALVSWRFENPHTGFVGEGVVEGEDGDRETRFSWRTPDDESGEEGQPLPTDLPVIPTYLVETLAAFMPREVGACLHYRPLQDGSGAIGRPTALVAAAKETLDTLGEQVETTRFEVRQLGGGVVSSFWVDAEGGVRKSDYVGALARRTTREKALEGLNPALKPRTAN